MNKAKKLFDKNFIKKLFKERVLPHYPDFKAIKDIKIRPYKDYIWEFTYHIVVEYQTQFETKDGKIKELPIYCSAHSDEPRKNVYDSLKFLWKNSFSKGYLSIPHPLFYSQEFKGTFYRGVKGDHLYHYIREKKLKEIKDIVPKAARWFGKLHNIDITGAKNFNRENSRIKTVIPGYRHIIERIKHEYPQYLEIYKQIYDIVINKEEEFLDSTHQRWLVHGDAHPENIIKVSSKKIAVIDFTDICLSDWTRDIGTFIQQLEYMVMRKIENKKFCKKIIDIFLESYFERAKSKYNNDSQTRIDNYYNWTMIRTATFFLIKDMPEPERAAALIKKLCLRLNIAYVN